MTAQQQLAELNIRQCKTLTDEADLRHDRARWLRDHGPAIAELFSAYAAWSGAVNALKKVKRNSAEHIIAERRYLAADRVVFSALEKLTEPKA